VLVPIRALVNRIVRSLSLSAKLVTTGADWEESAVRYDGYVNGVLNARYAAALTDHHCYLGPSMQGLFLLRHPMLGVPTEILSEPSDVS